MNRLDTKSRAHLRKAVELLREEADALRCSNTLDGVWPTGSERAHELHQQCIDTINGIESLLKDLTP